MELTKVLKANLVRTAGIGVFATSLLACASSAATTPQLADARRAYEEAESGPASTHAPGRLANARVALDRAESEHDSHPGSQREAYLAERAEHKAHEAADRGERRDGRDGRWEDTHAERVAPADTRSARHESQRTHKHASEALQSLAQVATVKEESRGVVITLSGSLLFPTGKQEISPIGNQSVDRVAHALAEQPDNTTFQVQGYTDSSGSDGENKELSSQRAQAVADRLTESGIDASRIRVVGRGEAAPIANNDTSDGRSSNRRVEIVVERDRT